MAKHDAELRHGVFFIQSVPELVGDQHVIHAGRYQLFTANSPMMAIDCHQNGFAVRTKPRRDPDTAFCHVTQSCLPHSITRLQYLFGLWQYAVLS